MKGHATTAVGDSQQAPVVRVELGRRDHHLDEFQWRTVVASDHDDSPFVAVLEEDLIGRVTVCEGLDMGDGHLPLLVYHEVVQGTHRPTGAASVSVRSGGVCASLV